jgi:hypothetical protein
MQKKILLTAAALAIVGTTLMTAQHAFAQTSDTTTNPMSSLVDKLATKFGLEKSQVQAVFDEERAAHQAEMRAKEEERLNTLVSEGKITQAQKQLIISKRQEMETQRESERESMQNMTAEERQAAMEAKRTALEQWATQNGIDSKYLKAFGRGGHGMRGGMHPAAE